MCIYIMIGKCVFISLACRVWVHVDFGEFLYLLQKDTVMLAIDDRGDQLVLK